MTEYVSSRWLMQSRLRERDSKWPVRNTLLDQANRRSDAVLRYEGCREKCILQTQSRATEATHRILRNENPGKSAGILQFSQPAVRRAYFWWRRECPPKNEINAHFVGIDSRNPFATYTFTYTSSRNFSASLMAAQSAVARLTDLSDGAARLDAANLVPHLGTASRVSEVMSCKHELSMIMVRRLRKHFHVPADLLLTRSWAKG
jgi:hypothetical protein